MIEKDEYEPLFATPTTRWHRWFAWYPVDTADRGWRWLRPVWKRRIQSKIGLPGPIIVTWQYAVKLRNPPR